MGLFLCMKVITDINIQGTDKLVLCDNKVLQQLTQAASFMLQKRHLRVQPSVNMKIFIVLKDLNAKLLT